VQKFLGELRDDGNGAAAQTCNFYLQAFRQFCRWMVRDGRASESPVAHLSGYNVRTDRRHDRRALTVEEIRTLLKATQQAPDRFGMTGPERALVYRLALETGLRAGEIRTLTRGSFRLEGTDPTVAVTAVATKNKRPAIIPLRAKLARSLHDHLATKTPTAVAFVLPEKTAKMLRADLADARAKWLKGAKTQQERKQREETTFLAYRDDADRVADSHCLRHSFLTALAKAGVHPKTMQTMARHSDVKLTLGVYSHTLREDERSALDRLPNFDPPAGSEQRATGTDDATAPAQSGDTDLALCLARDGSDRCQSMHRNAGPEGASDAATGHAAHAETPRKTGQNRGLRPNRGGSDTMPSHHCPDSSGGQSSGLLNRRSEVRVLLGAFPESPFLTP
jgi:integrase